MSKPAAVVLVPKETVSDDRYLVVGLLKGNGDPVLAGEAIVLLESSKSTFEVHAPEDGFFFASVAKGDAVPVGAPLAYISADAKFQLPDPKQNVAATAGDKPAELGEGPRISKAARALMEQHGIGQERFKGRAAVTREDVLELVQGESSRSLEIPPAEPGEDRRILLLGGGGHAKMCIDLLRRLGTWQIIGILDSDRPVGSTVLEVPVIGRDTDDELKRVFAAGVRYAVNAVGLAESHQLRQRVYARLKQADYTVPTIVHPHATVEPSARLGEGNQVMAQAIVGSDARVGDDCIINSGALVSHDCRIADHVHISPGVILAGSVEVGSNTIIGMGTTVFLRTKIGRKVVVTNGVNLFRDVADGEVVKH